MAETGKTLIEFGNYVFDNDSIFFCKIDLPRDPIGVSLGIGTLTAEVLCTEPEILKFKLNTVIRVSHDDTRFEPFYAESVERKNAIKYRIKGTTVAALLDSITHYGGIYTGETVGEVLPSVFQGIRYKVKSEIAKIRLYGYLPIASSRKNLSQILLATGAIVKSDLDGVTRIEDVYNEVISPVSADDTFIDSSVKTDTVTTMVSITEHQYVKTPGTEETQLFEGTVNEGDLITFTNPVYDVVSDDLTILESHPNYVRVAAGTGTIRGKRYSHITREKNKKVNTAEIESVQKIDQGTLISVANSETVLNRFAKYCKTSKTYDLKYILDKQRTGEVHQVVDPYDLTIGPAYVKDLEIDFSKTLQGRGTYMPNYIPSRVVGGDSEVVRVVLTGDGEWENTLGATFATVVVIGAGAGGQGGSKGEDGGRTFLTLTREERAPGGTWSQAAAEPGKGGLPGEPGAGGKVFRTDITLVPGQKISYSCGVGGKGGEKNLGEGTPGTDTTFGEYSSANGSSSDSGYVDPITGDVYAKKGNKGFSGGDGGKGTDSELYGSDGKEVQGFKGGKGNKTTTRTDTYSKIYYYGGGGGGAAYGENGNPPEPEEKFSGGAGASAKPNPSAKSIGNGGDSGNGGGGAGSGGRVLFEAEPDPYNNGVWIDSGIAKGGDGSEGSDGADGGIILYLPMSKAVSIGWVKEKNGHLMLDKYGRRLIV